MHSERLTATVHPGHFGGLASDEGTSGLDTSICYSADHVTRHRDVELAASVIVQKV